MSGSGILPINSGPCLIRIDQNTLLNDTYLYTINDSIVPSNYILITSSNGLLAPTNNMYLSSIMTSTFIGQQLIMSSINNDVITYSTIRTTTNHIDAIIYSTIYGSSFNTNQMFISNLSTPITNTTYLILSSIIGYPNSYLFTNTIQYTSSLISKAGSTIFNTLFIDNISSSTSCYTNVLLSNSIVTTSILGNTLSTSIYSTNLFLFSTYSTPYISCLTGIMSSIIQNTLYVNLLNTSSISTINIAFSTVIVSTPINNNVISNNVVYSTIYGSSMYVSSFVGSTTNIAYVNMLSSNVYTLLGSTTGVSTLYASTISLQTMNGLLYYYTILSGSTITVSTVSTLFGNTIQSYQYNASSMNHNTLYTSSLTVSNGFISSLVNSTLTINNGTLANYTTSILSSNNMIISTILGSTISSNTLLTTQLSVLSGIVTTLNGNIITTSSLIISSSYITNNIICSILISTGSYSTCMASTMSINAASIISTSLSSITLSTIYNSSISSNSTISIGSYSISSILCNNTFGTSSIFVSTINHTTLDIGVNGLNLKLGNQALINNTTGSNNVAIGYQALLNTTTGSYQTVLGTNALSGNTTGSYHTAIGSGAGILNGFAGSYTSYIGYNAIPSGTGITNEIIVGGSATAGGTNVGYGNNSVALGNPSITKNILYGNVGIGTNSPIVALDVRGSYQQFGGNMSITNTTNGWSQVFVYSNGISGCGLFLNTSGRSTDGGTYTGTFRNDYGSIRLQGSGGYTTPTFGITVLPSGNVGINSNTPSNALDITGNVSISNQTNITSSINVINNIILNGTILNYSPIWTTNGTSIYTMNSVGINTSQPGSYALNIYGSVYLTGVLNVTGNITAVTASTNAINNPVTRNLNITCGSVYTGSMTCTDNGFTLIGDINTNYLTGTLNGGVAPVNLSYTNYPTLDLTRFTLDGNHVNAFPNSLYFTDATSTNQRDSGLLVSTDYNPTYIYSIGNKLYVQQLGLPTHGLYLNGSDANWYALSDRRVKTNIMPLSSMLLNVLSLNPVTFNYGKSTIDILDSSKNKNVGFIAQEVETIFPYCVSHETSDTSESPMLSITYELFIPYLIKAFQEEHTRIIKQEHQLNITTHHYNKIDITSIEHIHQSLLTNSERLDILEQKINLLMNTGVYT